MNGMAQRTSFCFSNHIYYTPKHGSWLNIAEIEFGALVRQCRDRRIPDRETLDAEAQAWAADRNEMVVKVDCRFTTADAASS